MVSPRTFGFFWIFLNFRSSGPPFFWIVILFFGFFLEFLQFRAFFFQNLTRTRAFFWNEVIFVVFGLRGGGGGFSRTFGFFGISAVLSNFFLDCFFVFWIFWNFCSLEPFFFKALIKPRF